MLDTVLRAVSGSRALGQGGPEGTRGDAIFAGATLAACDSEDRNGGAEGENGGTL